MKNYQHIELITETYPPEINGVALTVQALEYGLRNLGHRVGLVRPEQHDESPRHHQDLMLVEGAPICQPGEQRTKAIAPAMVEAMPGRTICESKTQGFAVIRE